jgi:hypothetical protein
MAKTVQQEVKKSSKTINKSRSRDFVKSSPTLVERVRGVEASVGVGNVGTAGSSIVCRAGLKKC